MSKHIMATLLIMVSGQKQLKRPTIRNDFAYLIHFLDGIACSHIRKLPIILSEKKIGSYDCNFFFLSWLPHGIWHSPARDQIQATVVTYATGTAIPDPQPTVPGQGSNLHLSTPEMPLIPLCHDRNSTTIF